VTRKIEEKKEKRKRKAEKEENLNQIQSEMQEERKGFRKIKGKIDVDKVREWAKKQRDIQEVEGKVGKAIYCCQNGLMSSRTSERVFDVTRSKINRSLKNIKKGCNIFFL
jgi:hypothetical protein